MPWHPWSRPCTASAVPLARLTSLVRADQSPSLPPSFLLTNVGPSAYSSLLLPSVLFFSPLDVLLFPSFLLPSLSLLFYSAVTRRLFPPSLSSLLSFPIHPSFTLLFRSSSLSFSLLPFLLLLFSFFPLSAVFFPSLLSVFSYLLVSSHLCRQPPKRNEEVSPLSSASPCLPFPLALSHGRNDHLLALVFDTARTLRCPHLSALLPPCRVRYLAFT